MLRNQRSVGALAVTVFTLLATGCADRELDLRADRTLHAIADRLTGSFSTTAQAEAEPGKYSDIQMRSVQILPEETTRAGHLKAGGIWLYVEQALTARPERPYRQRLYCVCGPAKGQYQIVVYRLKDPAPYVGAWRSPERFGPGDTANAEYCCALWLQHGPDRVWRAKAPAAGRQSEWEGPPDAIFPLEILEDEIRSWDGRTGGQPGAVAGPYRYLRQPPIAPVQ